MEASLYLLIPISVILVFLIGVLFWWSVRGGQFDDLEGPAYRLLMDDDKTPQTPETSEPAAVQESGVTKKVVNVPEEKP